jgi:hypothetical protein
MLHTHAENRANVIIGKRIKHRLPLTAKNDQLCRAQNAQLMGNGRHRHAKQTCDVTHAKLAAKQRVQDLNARAIPEYFEKLRKVDQGVLAWKLPAQTLEWLTVSVQ